MRVLIVLVESRGAEALIDEAASLAAGGHPVTVLQLCDPEFSDRVCKKLRQDGWLGAARSHQVSETLTADYQTRFDEVCEHFVAALRERGLEVRRVSRNGDIVNTTLRVAEEEGDVGLILVGKPPRSWLTRWFKDVNLRVLSDRAPCDVRYVTLPE